MDSTGSGIQISLKEYFTLPYVDKFAIAWILAGQGLILNMALFLGLFAGINPFTEYETSFTQESMTLAVQFATTMIIFGQVLDKLPQKIFQELAFETRVFVLRILGR